MLLSKSQKSPLESEKQYQMIKRKKPKSTQLTLIPHDSRYQIKITSPKKIRTNHETQGPVSQF